jgi:hypothetical protein
MTARELCPSCGEQSVLMPLRGRTGGRMLCAVCGQSIRRGEVIEAAPLTLVDGEEIDTEAAR